MIARPQEVVGESEGVETVVRSRGDLASDNADLARQLAEAQAENAKLKRDSLITHVGQRLLAANGKVLTVVEIDDIGRWNCRLRTSLGTDLHYDRTGKFAADQHPEWNLVGPAHDAEEMAQLKADNLRLIERIKRQSPLSQEEFDKIAQNATCITSRDDICHAIRTEVNSERWSLRRGNNVYLLIELIDRETVSPSECDFDVTGSLLWSPDGKGALIEISVK